MKYRQRLLVGLVAAAILSGGQLVQAAEFSARMVTKFPSQQQEGKIYVKGDRMRRETSAGPKAQIVIVVPEKKVVWMLQPQERTYMEMPIQAGQSATLMEMPKDKGDMKLLGTEKINGHDTDKYETKAKHHGGEMKYFIWVSKKLGQPIKMASPDGSVTMEYLDIKEGGVADNLFEVPQGYKKKSMPAMPQGMPKKQ